MKGENSRTTSCLHRRCVPRSHREYPSIPCARARPLLACLSSGRGRVPRLSPAQPDSVGHAFLAALPPSSVFIPPPTFRGLFSGAGGGGGELAAVRGGAFCSHSLRGRFRDPLCGFCAPEVSGVFHRERVLVSMLDPYVHVCTLTGPCGWIRSRAAETARGFPWLLPHLRGVHVLQQAEKTQFPAAGACGDPRAAPSRWRACSRGKSPQQGLLHANSPAA